MTRAAPANTEDPTQPSEWKVRMKRGFICLKCQTRLQVARTVNPCTGRVVRYRKCPKCGLNVVTEERERNEKVSISGATR
jgi:hypothetical protein